jgi:predicted Zn-dependent protease
MKSLLYLVLLALPALSAQETSGRAVGPGVNFYSIEKEAALGAQMAGDFQRQNQVLDDPQVNGYVRSVGERLVRQIPETGFTFHFAVFVDGEASGLHEARVLPGGYIYVPESLILTARDEAEFAGMLAHAVAHAANRDATRLASRRNAANLATIPLTVSGGWTFESARQNAEIIPIALLSVQRAFELEADARAVPVMAGAGWDPGALARYIEREQPAADPRKPGTTSRVFSTLPPRDERLAALKKAIDNLPPRDYAPSPEFAPIQAEVRGLKAARAPETAPPALNPPRK